MRSEYPTRTLGCHGPTVSAIGLGAVGLCSLDFGHHRTDLLTRCRPRGFLRKEGRSKKHGNAKLRREPRCYVLGHCGHVREQWAAHFKL